ncbi:hypothetical protein SIN8267_02036 [Sinobacterium norvegicum]|uniref:Bacterial surface antigen (D15) domain-containing protein n=2 Tax=Sinobacterium norvegicum TaxID=1641715 RepID=A0ABM9AFE5_9GAMM|nr:hypothetical protein SIN8267_02036 [Sinobacterium norvegicum]
MRLNHRRLLTSATLAASSVLLSSGAVADMMTDMFTDAYDGKFDASNYLSENAYGFLPVPIIITDPALGGGGLGMIGLFFHETDEEREQRVEAAKGAENAQRYLLPPSVSAIAGAYTANDSWFIGGGHFGFWKQDTVRYEGFFGYGDFNLDYYNDFSDGSILGDSIGEREFNFKTSGYGVIQNLKFRLPDSKVFLGVRQQFTTTEIGLNKKLAADCGLAQPACDQILNRVNDVSVETTLSGVGVLALYDNRDNVFSPQKGYNYEVRVTRYDELFGSDADFTSVEFKGLNYWPLSKKWGLGARLESNSVDGENVPLNSYPYIDMRGIPAMRYQGDVATMAEIEGRYLLNFRWTLTGFIGAGRTASSYSDIGDSSSQVAKGLGFRYLIARRYGFRAGVDIARGPEETAYYITAGSAW